jgi:hypothetical protein
MADSLHASETVLQPFTRWEAGNPRLVSTSQAWEEKWRAPCKTGKEAGAGFLLCFSCFDARFAHDRSLASGRWVDVGPLGGLFVGGFVGPG